MSRGPRRNPSRVARWALAALALSPAAAGAQPYAFVSHPATDSVSIVNLAGYQVTGTLPVAGVPAGLAMTPSGSRLFVTRAQANAVAAIDTATGGVSFVPSGTTPTAVAVNPAGTRAYVAVAAEDRLSVVDAITGALLGSISVGDAPVDVAAAGGRVCVANWGSGSVTVINDATGAVLGTVPVGRFPAGVALRPDGARAYVASFRDGTVAVVDTATLSVVATITIGGRPRGLATTATRLFVTDFDGGRVIAVDTATHAIVGQADSGAPNPIALAVTPGGQRLYVAHTSPGKNVTVLEAATLTPLGAIETPSAAGGIAIGGQAPPLSGARWSRLRARAAEWLAPRPSRPPLRTPDGIVTITDTEFVPADWQIFLVEIGEFSVGQQTSGGNPGAFRQVAHFGGGAPVGIGHRLVRPDAIYDPSVQGAIEYIDASWDRRLLTSGSAVESVVVRQGGVNYRSSEVPLNEISWQPASRTGLTAADFTSSGGGSPDFSAAGGPIAFGYYRRTPAGVAVTHGIDNFEVVVHQGGGGPTPGVIALRETSLVALATDQVDVVVERLGGQQGAVSATLFYEDPDGLTSAFDVDWLDSDGTPKVVSLSVSMGSGSRIRLGEATLLNPTGGATIHPQRSTLEIFVVPDDWPPSMAALVATLRLLFSAFTPSFIAVLAVVLLAAWLVRRRKALVGVVVLGALPLSGCCPTERVEIDSPDLIWNDRVRLDGQALVDDSSACVDEQLACLQRTTDPWVGFYRTAERDVVSELYPELGSDQQTRRLVQSDCLWTPQGQLMRASWEAVVALDPSKGFGSMFMNGEPDMPEQADVRYGVDYYPGGVNWVSACRLTTPYDRRPADLDLMQACQVLEAECPGCEQGPYWAAVKYSFNLKCDDVRPGDTWALTQNVGPVRESVFDMDLRAAPYRDPRPGHNLCAPALPWTADPSVTPWLTDCPTQEGLADACGDKCALRAEQDATLTVTSMHYERTRALSPTLMTVSRQQPRRLVRGMESSTPTSWSWRTPISTVRNDGGPPNPEAPGLRWVENFTPDLRVQSVRVLRINASGVETPLPVTRLLVLDAVPSPPVTWECPGELLPDGSRIFRLLDAQACRKGDAALTPLTTTPTYVVANLTTPSATAPLVDAPLTWQVELPAAQPAGQVYVEFSVVNQACVAPTCNALRASQPEVDLGRLQTGQPHQSVVEVTNVGPEALRVGTIRMEAIAGYPDARADFALEALLDPQPLAMPIELTVDGLGLGSDFPTHPLARLTTSGGHPAIVRPLDEDGGRATWRGVALEARGRARFESHRIVHGDPTANFSVPPVPGVRRPFAQIAHLRRQPPFYLNPGSSLWVRVTTRPGALGSRRARLSIGATADSNPSAGVWTSSVLKVTGIAGPSISVIPGALSLPRPHLDASGQVVPVWELGAFVANYGGVDMQRTTIAITGPDAARFLLASTHPPARTIPPGHDESFRVRYVPSCAPPAAAPPAYGPRQYRAQLRVTTNGGDAVVELRGEHCPLASP